MDYEPIDRITSRFHVSYSPGRPTNIYKLTSDGERLWFWNHTAQTDFLCAISDRAHLTDEVLDAACIDLVGKQCQQARRLELEREMAQRAAYFYSLD